MMLLLMPMWFLCGAVFPVSTAMPWLRVPMWANAPIPSEAYGPGFRERFDFPPSMGIVNQGESGEMMAEQWGLEREELDRFAMTSHLRAAAATAHAPLAWREQTLALS